MPQPRKLTVLGSTGSVGVSTLDVVARHRERFEVVALTAHRNVDVLFAQCVEFRPRYAAIDNESLAADLAARLRSSGSSTEVLAGPGALEAVAAVPDCDTVMAAIVGIAGLKPTFAAVQAGKRVLLANKEALVTAGAIFMDEVRRREVTLIPIDSEHNAIFQVLPGDFARNLAASGIRRILLTASGGPFRDLPPERLPQVTPEQACAHPNWVMGRKISVDSATMMNKGLEVIEACWLFGADERDVEVVIHAESVIHSLVEYRDGSVLAQLGNPDMRTPIAFALGYPDRIDAGVGLLDLVRIGHLRFAAPDGLRFPCLALAREAMRAGGSAPAVLNAANEVAVAAFLDRRLRFDRISALIADVLATASHRPIGGLDDVFAADADGRRHAATWLARQSS